MIIQDNRFKKKELSFDQLQTGELYVSSRLQAYVVHTAMDEVGYFNVNLEDGTLYFPDDHIGDVFEPVKATLVVE